MNKRQNGTAAIEFALIFPLFIILIFITTEIGRALYQYNVLAKSVRDAARYLSSQNPGTKISESTNLIVYGSLTNTGIPLAIGLDTNHVKTPEWSLKGSSPVINTVTVRIAGCASSPPPCYKFAPMVSSVFKIDIGNINYADITATMRSPL